MDNREQNKTILPGIFSDYHAMRHPTNPIIYWLNPSNRRITSVKFNSSILFSQKKLHRSEASERLLYLLICTT